MDELDGSPFQLLPDNGPAAFMSWARPARRSVQRPDNRGDSQVDNQDDDFRWLTYAELAAMRGISRTSAERLVLRRRWRKQKGNDGAVRVSVPATFLTSPDTSPDASPDTSPDLSPDLRARIKDLEAELASTIEQLTARALSEAVALAQIAEKEEGVRGLFLEAKR